MLDTIKKEVRDIKRLREIVLILFDQGFDYVITKTRLAKFVPFKERLKKIVHKGVKLRPEERLRVNLEKLGPTFIKFGQLLSVRPDLIPKEYVRELGKLLSEVPSFSFNEVEKQIEKELKKQIKDIFKSFDKNPIAAASISQVHKARLKDGKMVAVKVQRPNAKEIMETDIEIMYYLAKLVEKYMPKIRRYHPVRIIHEFEEWTENELNFKVEANNAKKFYNNFKGSKTVIIPNVIGRYSTEKVLVMDFIQGIELHDLNALKKTRVDIKKVIKNGFEAIMTQVFVHGFFHADLHPGNILVLKGGRIGLIDFGIVGYFDDYLKQKSIELFYGIVDEDMDFIVDTFLSMGLVNETETDIELFKEDIRKVIEPLQKSKLKDIKVSLVLEEVLDIALKHHVRLPVDFVLFGKALLEIEGIGLEYDPDFRFVDSSRPFLERLIKREYNIKSMTNDFMKTLVKFKKFLEELPDNATKALKKIQQGKVDVDIEDTDIKTLSLEIDKSSNRLAYGMIIAALIVAGAWVMDLGKPILFGMPFVSLFSFLIAIILAVVLFKSILDERKIKL